VQRNDSRIAPRPGGLRPVPTEVGPDFTVRSCETEILNLAQDASGQETPKPSSSSQVSLDGLQDQQRLSSRTTKETPFAFSSPQTLFPALVPKRGSPYAEFLKFTRDRPRSTLWPHGVTATLAACLFNARALGIDIGRVLDPYYVSPFYRPSNSLVLPPGSGEFQPTNLDVTSDPQLAMLGPLRPCFAQVIFPHQACIDLLPLPRLRETAVMLHVRAQRERGGVMSLGFDGVQELKKDVYVRQGVRFRGTGELRGDEYIMHDDSGRHCGHPWERGSWAIAPWFVTKWKYLAEV
jgi:hypothetical protein